jgi:hypothetical protein
MRAIWCYDLRQPSERFWHSTPREFNALWKRHKEAVQQASIQVIQLAQFSSMWLNSHLPESAKKTEPADFIPNFEGSDREESHRQDSAPQGPHVIPSDPFAGYAKMMATRAILEATDISPIERARRMAALKEQFPDATPTVQ